MSNSSIDSRSGDIDGLGLAGGVRIVTPLGRLELAATSL